MMKAKLKPLLRACTAFTCATVLMASPVLVSAGDSVSDLEQETQNLQSELQDLNEQLSSISGEITSLASKIESMKKRIQYIYENGNVSFLEILFTSDSMGEFLNRVDFVERVTDYDRKMLKELQDLRQDIDQKEKNLKKQKEELDAMKQEMTSKQSESSQKPEDHKKPSGGGSSGSTNNSNNNNTGNSGTQKPGTGGSTTQKPAAPAETTDLVLFAAILECEAGSSGYDGLLAVATVIMNRVESPRYPNTLKGVIYQSGQFSPTWNGSLNRVLERGPSSLCYQVARDALNGKRLSSVSGCYQFRAAYTGHIGTVVGGNVFF